MNDNVWRQLNMVKVADLPPFDKDTISLIIPKKEMVGELYPQEGQYYLIELQNYLLQPSDTFTLHANWNNNIIPHDKYMKCECIKVMGKMFKIEGVGFDYLNKKDLDTTWCGWLPIKSVKILKVI